MERLYIKGKIMSPLEESDFKKYYFMMKNGDENARLKLIERSCALVLSIVLNKYRNTRHEYNDLFQVGCIGLIKAVDTFDINKGKFSSYAYICILNEINIMLNSDKKFKKDISLDFKISEDDTILDLIVDNIDIEYEYEENELIITVKKIISNFPNLDREILYLYFGKNLRHIDIAKIYNVSQSTICRLIKDDLKIISNKLKYQGYINKNNNLKMKKRNKSLNSFL